MKIILILILMAYTLYYHISGYSYLLKSYLNKLPAENHYQILICSIIITWAFESSILIKESLEKQLTKFTSVMLSLTRLACDWLRQRLMVQPHFGDILMAWLIVPPHFEVYVCSCREFLGDVVFI